MQIARQGLGADASERRSEGQHVTGGLSWAEPVLASPHGVNIGQVFFEPGARTEWHAHEHGQVLHVSAGHGWVIARDGSGGAIAAGDTVFIDPGEEHWHGASADHYLLHLAVSLGGIDWLGPVSDADYAAAG